MTSTAPRRCRATSKQGRPCLGYALHGSDFCITHDPARAADRAKFHSKGGKARHGRKIGPIEPSAPPSIVSLEGIQALLGRAIGDCLKCEPSLARARTLGYLAGIAHDLLKTTELEARITALEQRLAAGATLAVPVGHGNGRAN